MIPERLQVLMINIYRIHLKSSDQWYVGQTKHHPEVRMFQHWSDRNKIPVCGIGLIMREHAFEEFEVELLEKVEPALARTKEQEWIKSCGTLNQQNAVKDPNYDSNYSREYRRKNPRKNRVDGYKQYDKAKNTLLEKTICSYCLQEVAQACLRRHIIRHHED